jgi:hypothetical protein
MSEPAAETAGWVPVGEIKSLASSGRLHACVEVRVLIVTVMELPTVLRLSFVHNQGLAAAQCCTATGNLTANYSTSLLQGRYVSVLRIKGQLTCIDSICFHAGGPLVSPSACAGCCCVSYAPSASCVNLHTPHFLVLVEGVGMLPDARTECT